MKLTVFVLLFCCACTEVFSIKCLLPSSIKDDKHMPVLIDNTTSTYKFVMPHEGEIDLNKGDNIILSCPNGNNFLKLTKTNSTVGTCVKDETLKVIKKNVDFEDILCNNTLKGSALATNVVCGGKNGKIIKLGFPVEHNQFLSLIEVCYDSDNGNALYASHDLIGKEIKNSSKTTYRPNFSTAELGPNVAADVAYKRTFEKATFNKVLKSAKLAEQYINDTSYLARGHLSPDADFLYASWQFSTFFYVNTVPQWQVINNGNWKKLEMLARDTSYEMGKNLKVYTGSHSVLQLLDVNDVSTKIYLVSTGNKLAIPKFIWKILYDEKSKKAIAFVVLNNPFLEKLEKSDLLCTNVCDQYGWNYDNWSNGKKGFMYCCDPRDLLKVVTTGPKIQIKGILEGTKALRYRYYL